MYRKINIYRRNKLPFLSCVFSHCFIVYKSPKLLVSIANLKALCSLFHLLLALSSESPFLYCHPSCPVTTINSEGQGQEVTMPPPNVWSKQLQRCLYCSPHDVNVSALSSILLLDVSVVPSICTKSVSPETCVMSR